MTREISYTAMRRLLGLPEPEPTGRWAVRKIRSGVHRGEWGVWRCAGPGNEAPGAAPQWVDSFAAWPDAIGHIERIADDA